MEVTDSMAELALCRGEEAAMEVMLRADAVSGDRLGLMISAQASLSSLIAPSLILACGLIYDTMAKDPIALMKSSNIRDNSW